MDVRGYLGQGDIWYAANGDTIKVPEMAPDYASLAARWLLEHATGLILVVEAAKNEDALHDDGDVRDVLSLVAQSPKQWMTSQPLYRALIKVVHPHTVLDAERVARY